MSSWRWKNLNILSSWASDVEFRSLKSTIKIIDIDKAIVFGFRENFSILPRHEVVRRAGRTFGFWCGWTEQETIEFAVIHSIVFLNLTVNFWERRQFGLDLKLWLREVSTLKNLNHILSNLSGTKLLFIIEFNGLSSFFCRVSIFEINNKLSCRTVPNLKVLFILLKFSTRHDVSFLRRPLH